MFTAGMIKPANTTPITKIVDTMDLMVTHSLISIETIKRKNTPQIKASLDKNSSQRIRSFYMLSFMGTIYTWIHIHFVPG